MPDDFSFQLYPDDLDRLEWYIEDAMARVPLLGTQGVSRNINGPIPYAPDGLPMIGPMPGVANAFEAAFLHLRHCARGWRGQGGWPNGSCMAGPNGTCGRSIRDAIPTIRTINSVIDKAMETYGHEYGMHFPIMPGPRS